MHSPLSFFIFVMSTLFFADLIPGIFRTPLKSSRILWMSCCLFTLFFSDTFFTHLLTSFSRCFSSLGVLLLSSMSLRISASLIDKSSLTFAAADAICCCRCHHARFIIVVLDFARVAAEMEHDRTCLFTLMWKLCTQVFFSFVFRMIFTLRALFRQSLSCQHVAAAAAATSTTSAGCIRPIVLTPVLNQSYVQSSLSQATPSNKISGFTIDSWSHTPTR